MGKKLIIGIIFLIILVFIGALTYVLFKPISSNGPELKLTDDKIISDPQIIDLIINKKISPNGGNLTKMILDEDDPNIADEPWKFAFYVCNENEHSGWIYVYDGGDKKPILYGPYGWCLQ